MRRAWSVRNRVVNFLSLVWQLEERLACVKVPWRFAIFVVAIFLVCNNLSRAQVRSPNVGFHHVHMKVVDPEQSISFYTSSFTQTQRTEIAGWDAVRSENAYLLFEKVLFPISIELDSALWHFGWNSPDLIADYRRLSAQGVDFFRVPPPSGHMMGPDGNDVEISLYSPNSGGNGPRAFNHVHLMSDAPLCAAQWYEQVLGLRRISVTDDRLTGNCRAPFGPRRDPGNQIHQPNARLRLGDIILFIYPNQRPSRTLVSSRGHVLDHIGLTVDGLTTTLADLKVRGVKVLESGYNFGDTTMQAAMIEGPDGLAIELVERSGQVP